MSQDVDSMARPEHVIEENGAEDEGISGSNFNSNTRDPNKREEVEQLATIRIEDQVDTMSILLMMQTMQKKIDLLMKKHSLINEEEAAVVIPQMMKLPKKIPVSRSNSLMNEEASQI